MGTPDGFKPWRGDAYPRRLSHKPSIYYLAYGSNLLPERIYGRCPDAVYAGRVTLAGWRMLFKKSLSGCYATIEQDANREVPCIAFKISEYDEAMLATSGSFRRRSCLTAESGQGNRKSASRTSCMRRGASEPRRRNTWGSCSRDTAIGVLMKSCCGMRFQTA